MTKHYSCIKKSTARLDTIVEPYKELFGLSTLPKEKQYYTLCAVHHDDKQVNGLIKGTELDQLLENGFLIPSQFYGIDSSKEIIETNKLIKFASGESPNWFHGSLDVAINVLSRSENYNPGIINCDFTCMPLRAANTIKQILEINSDQKQVMVVCNLVLKSQYARYVKAEKEELFECFEERSVFNTAAKHGWITKPVIYLYDGTGENSKTQMGTVIFWKK